MQRQPAYVNYFFKGGYVEFAHTIGAAFEKCGDSISDAGYGVSDAWGDLGYQVGDAFDSTKNILAFEADWSDVGEIFKLFGVSIKFCFFLFKLICIAVFTSLTTVIFSVLHTAILALLFIPTYLWFLLIKTIDAIYCGFHKIGKSCPNCQHKIALPVYVCNCGRKHTKLVPSKYGIVKRTCECGRKLPTTFLNGRYKLEALCPVCGYNFVSKEESMSVSIPVIGGPSAGKTCYINMAISSIEESARDTYGLEFEFEETGIDDYEENKHDMENGVLPQKTSDMRLKYYRFYLSPPKTKVRNLISVCDVGGEVFEDSQSLGEQVGFGAADAFLLVVDPLSITDYKREVAKNINVAQYGGSAREMDEVVSRLLATLESMCKVSSKDSLKMDVAVALTKIDIPGLEEKIGDTAVREYLASNPKLNYYDAQSKLCEQFLVEYGAGNFLNSLRSRFKSVQFFACSALGHVANGEQFVSYGVEDPLLWLIDKACQNIKLKHWSKKLKDL